MIPEHDDLQQIDRDHTRARGTQTFQDGNSLPLLLDESTSNVPHAHASEHQNEQARQRQIVFGPHKLFIQVLLLLAIGIHLQRRCL